MASEPPSAVMKGNIGSAAIAIPSFVRAGEEVDYANKENIQSLLALSMGKPIVLVLVLVLLGLASRALVVVL